MAEDSESQKISTFETYVSTPNERTVLVIKAPDESLEQRLGLLELKVLNFWKTVFAEFLTTVLFIIISCGCTLGVNSHLHVALCTGFGVAALISVNSEYAGYFNPAISFGLLVARKIKLVRFLFYVAVQIAGSKYIFFQINFQPLSTTFFQ